jgi:imidazolonepropionase
MEGNAVREIEGGAVAVREGRILWAGKESQLASHARVTPDTTVVDAGGGVVTPGFIDCHTHLVFAGSREKEFQMRMEGKTYLEILQAGGGILSTVRTTRAASEDELVEAALPRLRRLLRFGVTTCEAKSGYGLDTESELKLLRVIRKLASLQPVKLVPTLLGAHAVPAELRERREKYIDTVVGEMIPAAARQGLARFCDVYLEKSAFSLEETEKILTAAMDAGLLPKLHAGQFNDLGGAELGARLGASSVDHLENVSDEGLGMMAQKGVVAVTLPGAAFFTREKRADCARMARAGVRVAVSTDLNPGSSPTENLPLMMTMSVVDGGLSMQEALLGVTASAAAALALPATHGTLAPGAPADILVHDAGDWRRLIVHFAVSHVRSVVIDGKVVLP